MRLDEVAVRLEEAQHELSNHWGSQWDTNWYQAVYQALDNALFYFGENIDKEIFDFWQEPKDPRTVAMLLSALREALASTGTTNMRVQIALSVAESILEDWPRPREV